jgi:transposase InsO family protein
MKEHRPGTSLARLTGLLGFTRQAYYQYFQNQQELKVEHQLILEQVYRLRKDNPMMGTRKLHWLLQDYMKTHQIKMGRDALFNLLAENYMLIRRRRRRSMLTTDSRHWLKRYPNLIQGLESVRPDQVWVSDITYLKTKQGYVYISFVTDAFSHKIMGYNLAGNLETINTLKALQMAIEVSLSQGKTLQGLIHHSDQGFQYCSSQYVNMLKKYGIRISMSDKGEPLQNPVAERVNGIIKHEYLFFKNLDNKLTSLQFLHEAVQTYNSVRPHLSCNMLTPEKAYLMDQPMKKRWKNYYKKPANNVNACQD